MQKAVFLQASPCAATLSHCKELVSTNAVAKAVANELAKDAKYFSIWSAVVKINNLNL